MVNTTSAAILEQVNHRASAQASTQALYRRVSAAREKGGSFTCGPWCHPGGDRLFDDRREERRASRACRQDACRAFRAGGPGDRLADHLGDRHVRHVGRHAWARALRAAALGDHLGLGGKFHDHGARTRHVRQLRDHPGGVGRQCDRHRPFLVRDGGRGHHPSFCQRRRVSDWAPAHR